MPDFLSLPFEEDMTQAEIEALIDARFVENAFRNYSIFAFNHSMAVPGTSWGGRRTANWTESARGPVRTVTTPVAANGIFEVTSTFLGAYPWAGSNTVFHWPTRIKMVVRAGTLPSTIAGECFMGIEIGTFGLLPPWSTTYTPDGFNAVAQLRYNFTLSRWEICLYAGDPEIAPEVTACDINPTFLEGEFRELELIYTPNTSDQNLSTLKAYIDGVLAKTITGGRLVDLYVAFNDEIQAGYFLTNGSDAAARHTNAVFIWGMCYTDATVSNS